MSAGDDTITTIRDIMRGLAAAIRDGGADGAQWPAGVKAPIVFLDGISDEWEPAPEEADAPLVVVAGTGDSHDDSGGDLQWTVEVLVAMDCSSPDLNAAPSQDPGDGIRVAGDGERFQAVGNAVTNIVRHARPGALLRQIDRRWSFHTLPVQFVVVTLTFMSPQTYGDIGDDLPITF